MALTPEQIDRLIQQADGRAPKEGSIFRTLVKLTEAEVRKQDDALIQQMLGALEKYQAFIDDAHIIDGQRHWLDDAKPATTAARARLGNTP